MTDTDAVDARQSAFPWMLYQSHHLGTTRSARRRDGLYVGMLKEDLQNYRYSYDLSIIPHGVHEPRASQLLAALLEDFNHTSYDSGPAELVVEFAMRLLEESSDGKEMTLELHSADGRRRGRRSRHGRHTDDPDQRPGPLPTLGFIPQWSVTKHRTGLLQFAPEAGHRPTPISSSRLHSVSLRRENKRNWDRAIKGLRQVDTTDLGGYSTSRISWKGYEFSKQLTAQKLVIAASTAGIGWDARGTFNDYVTSPYLTFRQLRFVKFWVESIEDSVSFLNQFTGNASLYGSDAFTFSLAGLPSPEDLLEAMDAVRSGSLNVKDAYDTFFYPKHAKSRID
ncbi:hypothetical protein ABZS29_26400 [Kribbella sp. NPDC005582]|uniref:hypothetical protein n=1 Tax=Kribbella sp. NPDC005582 TaxID=3156893 RepID=UPI0033B9A9B5